MTAAAVAYVTERREAGLLEQLAPARPDNTAVLNAIYALSEDVRELREALITPERRLHALGLAYAEKLP